MDRFEYSVIRFRPEAFRGEQVNVGIVVFRQGALDIRLHVSPSLVKALGADPSTLEWMPDAFREFDDPELPSRSRWQRLSHIPGFVLSELGWLVADDDEQYEQRLDRIRTDYIDRKRAPVAVKRSSSLVRELRRVFAEYRILGKSTTDVDRHKVVSNLPVGPLGRLQVDFVVKNGVYHATETADFRMAGDVGLSEFKEAALASMTLQCAREQLGRAGTKCYLVYSASPIAESAIYPALQLAERGVDRTFNMASGEQRRDYYDVMLAAAGSPQIFDKN